MSPDFSAAVDPILMYILSVMDDIEKGRSPSGEEVRIHASGIIDHAEVRVGQQRDWAVAKYALVAWVDEVLIDSPWEERSWWEQNRLEFHYFSSSNAFTKFYERAKEATAFPRKDALEVFYICVVLGFRGVYGDPTASAHAAESGLPSTLEKWARQTSIAIQFRSERPTISNRGQPGMGAPPLEGKFLFIGWVVIAVILILIAFATAWYCFSPKTG